MSEVIKLIEAPHLTFSDWNKAFDFLAENEKEIIGKKKSMIHESVHKFKPDYKYSKNNTNKHLLVNKLDTVKGLINYEDDKYYAIINTTNVLDNHRDVHINGIWNKSAREKNRKTYYVFDHELRTLSIIAKARDVEIKVIPTTFKDLGYDIDKNTEALTFIFNKNSVIPKDADVFLEDDEMQNSIRMRYIDAKLCMNSDRIEHKAYLDNYNKYYDSIANKDDYEDEGLKYFYAVLEAEIVNEGSLVPLGSNRFTPIKYFKEAAKSTSQDSEPSNDTQIDWNKVINNF